MLDRLLDCAREESVSSEDFYQNQTWLSIENYRKYRHENLQHRLIAKYYEV